MFLVDKINDEYTTDIAGNVIKIDKKVKYNNETIF